MRELSLDEINSYLYTVPVGGIQFNHHETMAVPAGVFTAEYGTFSRLYRYIIKSINSYSVLRNGYLFVDYERIDEQAVRLSAHSGAKMRHLALEKVARPVGFEPTTLSSED